MNASLFIGLVVGGIAVAVFFKASRAARQAADTIDRRVRRTLPGFCADCSGSSLDHRGLCATCGSNAIWTPMSEITLPAYEAVEAEDADKAERHAEIAAKTRARFGTPVTESEAIQGRAASCRLLPVITG